MADIAQLGFAADTSALKDAKGALDSLVPATERAEKSSSKLSSSLAKVDSAADKLNAAAAGLSSAVDKMSRVLEGGERSAISAAAAQGVLTNATSKVSVTFNAVATAAKGASTATQEVAAATGAASAGLGNVGAAAASADTQLEQLDVHMTAYRANLRQMKIDQMAAGSAGDQYDAHLVAYRQHLDEAGEGARKVGQAIKFTAQDSLNATRQLADIGVTAAMGMSPFMIAIQQGPQLLDILQNKAAMTGQSLGAVFRAAGAAIWTALAPLLPIIAGIALAVGTVAAAFGLATREINKGSGDIAAGLGLTEKQMERVKKSGVDTGVTIGDTFKAFFGVIGDRIAWLLGGPLKSLKDGWNATLDFITKYGALAIKAIYGGFVGGFMAIKASWSLLPAAIGDIVYSAANKAIAGVEYLINKSIEGLNKLIGFANAAAAKVGLSGLGTLGGVSLGQVKNPFAGAASQAGTAIAAGFAAGKKESDAAIDRFFGDVAKRARSNREKLIRDAAGKGDPAGAAGAAGGGGKSDGAKFSDIVTGAQNDIATQKARADAVNLSAQATATLEEKTKLLNEAQSKGIVLTAAMRGKIDELAAAYGAAKVAADNAIALRDILKTADADIAGLRSQAELIGLVGRQLAYQTEMQKLLNDAKAKGLVVDAAMRGQFEAKANAYADQASANDALKAYTDQMNAMNENIDTMEAERAALGLNAVETAKLAMAQKILNDEKYRGIIYSDQQKRDLIVLAGKQAEVTKKLQEERDNLEFAKGAAKDFFKDFIGNLEKGKSLLDSLGDAFLNFINKLADKALDKLLNAGLDALFNAISSGAFKNGGTFDSGGVTGFARGGTFTNSIIDKPTMFASGGLHGLGIMGEAGPEAIMPLKRGSDGSLGVEMHGGASGGGTVIHAPITFNNDNRVSGAVSSTDIVELQRRSAEQTKDQLRREIPAIINEHRQNGAIV